MKTNKLTYSTPIPKVKEYVRNIVSRHNAGVQYPSSLNEVSRLFFKDKKNKGFYKRVVYRRERLYHIGKKGFPFS